MPTVMIYQSPRSTELKRRTAAAVTNVLVECYGLEPDQIHVYFHESDDESWARGGTLAADRRAASPSGD